MTSTGAPSLRTPGALLQAVLVAASVVVLLVILLFAERPWWGPLHDVLSIGGAVVLVVATLWLAARADRSP